jgi:hypothetical protein
MVGSRALIRHRNQPDFDGEVGLSFYHLYMWICGDQGLAPHHIENEVCGALYISNPPSEGSLED